MSEALIFASSNPQYDDRLFIELQVQYMKIPSSEHGENMLCTEIVFDIQNNFCTQHVLPKFCKRKSFWQDLPVNILIFNRFSYLHSGPQLLLPPVCFGMSTRTLNFFLNLYWTHRFLRSYSFLNGFDKRPRLKSCAG